jgi:hypothetical protein
MYYTARSYTGCISWESHAKAGEVYGKRGLRLESKTLLNSGAGTGLSITFRVMILALPRTVLHF